MAQTVPLAHRIHDSRTPGADPACRQCRGQGWLIEPAHPRRVTLVRRRGLGQVPVEWPATVGTIVECPCMAPRAA